MSLFFPHVLMPAVISELAEQRISSDPGDNAQPTYWPVTRGMHISAKLKQSGGSSSQEQPSGHEAAARMDEAVDGSLSQRSTADAVLSVRTAGAAFPGCIQVGCCGMHRCNSVTTC